MSEIKLKFGYYEDGIGISSVSHFLEHEEWEITITFAMKFVVDKSTLSELQQSAADHVREVPLQLGAGLGGDHEQLGSSHTGCLQGKLQLHYEDYDRLPYVDGDTHQSRAGLQHQHVGDLYDELGSQQLHHSVPDKYLHPLLCLDDEGVARGVRDQHQHAQHLAQGDSQGQHSQHVGEEKGEEKVVTIQTLDIYTGPQTFCTPEEITITEMERGGAGQVPEVHDSQLGCFFRHGVRGDGPEAGGDTHQSLVCGRPAARAALTGVGVPLVTTNIQESRF